MHLPKWQTSQYSYEFPYQRTSLRIANLESYCKKTHFSSFDLPDVTDCHGNRTISQNVNTSFSYPNTMVEICRSQVHPCLSFIRKQPVMTNQSNMMPHTLLGLKSPNHLPNLVRSSIIKITQQVISCCKSIGPIRGVWPDTTINVISIIWRRNSMKLCYYFLG